jgi:hypothetical protein
MATVSSTEFRPTDIYQYIPLSSLLAGTLIGGSGTLSAGHIKVACFQEPVRVLEMVVVTGAGAVTGCTIRAAYGAQSIAVTSDLTTTLGAALTAAASTLAASANNSLPIDTATTYGSVDTLLPPVVPPGSVIGINVTTTSTSTAAVVGVYLRYRPA